MTAKQLLLIEDNPTAAQLVRTLLESTGTLAVQIAASVREGERQALAKRPDVAMIDLSLPDGDGVDLIARLRNPHGRPRLLALTSATGADRVLAALRAGANGYLFKDDICARLIPAIDELCAGGAPLSAKAAAALLGHLQIDEPRGNRPRLTQQESVILDLLALGSGYAEIGEQTRTSINTVRSHVRAVYEKLGVTNRAEAVNLGWRLGLLRRPSATATGG